MNEYKVQPLDLMQYINTKYHEPFIHELIEFDSKLDIEKFSDALDKLLEVFPILKCRYDSERNLFIENEIVGNGLLKIDDNADREMILTESLDMSERLVRFTLSKNTLVITISHLVCDGSGFKQLIYLLCDFYNGNNGGDYTHIMNREFSQLTKDLTWTSGMMVKMLFSMLGGYKNKQVIEKSDDAKMCLVEKAISAEVMKKVHGLAKKQNATLNDVFLTAFARATSRLYNRKKINIPCTVDLRKYTRQPTGVANLTGTYNLNVEIDVNDSFGESLKVVTREMNKQKKTKNDIAGPMLLVSKYEKTSLDKFLKFYGGMNTSPFTDYTNLGRLDEKKLTFNGVTVKNAIGYSGVNYAPYFQLAISSFKNVTILSSINVCGHSEKEKIRQLLEVVA